MYDDSIQMNYFLFQQAYLAALARVGLVPNNQHRVDHLALVRPQPVPLQEQEVYLVPHSQPLEEDCSVVQQVLIFSHQTFLYSIIFICVYMCVQVM